MATRTAVIAPDGRFTYEDLDRAAASVAGGLLDGRHDLEEARVAFLLPPSFAHVAVARGIWRAGGMAVPLAISHPPVELDYVIRDAEASIVVGDAASANVLAPIARAAGATFVASTELLQA